MASEPLSSNVRDHGEFADKKRKRVKCNYCGKEMSGFSRLRYHLGDVGTDVVSCPKVSEDVKTLFRDLLLETKAANLGKEVGQLLHPDLPLKRKSSPNSTIFRNDKCGANRSENVVPEHLLASSSRASKQTEAHGKISLEAQESIAKFFYETGIDFSIANSPSFRRMIVAVHGNGQVEIPTSRDLERIIGDELRGVQEYVHKVRHSWASTGCSVLLDGWVDKTGRTLVNFLVECPEGPIYLRSIDVSTIVNDVDALESLVEEVIKEVGTENVLQIVACSTTGWMDVVRKKFLDRHGTVFWSLSASHCIDLMLENIGKMDSIRSLLEKAKVITRFIYGHPEVLKLARSHTCEYELVKRSSLKSVASFLTLENMVLQKKNLMTMVSSFEWRSSSISSLEGNKVTDLVRDISFWTEAEMALKGTTPLLRVLELIHTTSEPLMCSIYEMMDQVKETIKEGFNNKKSQYEPVWKVIDEIWDGNLHSPLHAAGYYLNPSLFYSTDFYNDSEVSFGLLSCIIRLVQDQGTQDKISTQLNDYRHVGGDFREGSAIHQRTNVSPAHWWSLYGKEYPELQNFAIRILSQTCDGASKYGLERDLAEKFLTHDTNLNEQKRLSELTAVCYNLNLRNRYFGLRAKHLCDLIDSSDWI